MKDVCCWIFCDVLNDDVFFEATEYYDEAVGRSSFYHYENISCSERKDCNYFECEKCRQIQREARKRFYEED